MRKNLAAILLLVFCILPQTVSAQSSPIQFSDIQPELEGILSKLATNLAAFEQIQKNMDNSATSQQNYNELKNIFLSSTLAIATIGAICEYERDLLTLFIDLKEKNRRKFYDVRIESMETSVRQIKNMYRQIQINYTIFPPNFFEAPLVRKERLTIESSVNLLKRCGELLNSVNRR
ncbi:MAG: hypothetical protein JSW26_29555 [Desulfobacterales bacterium]|nr:MAG: hypothetical protein JSW26_29555 [Desulfobacterales bacterium]